MLSQSDRIARAAWLIGLRRRIGRLVTHRRDWALLVEAMGWLWLAWLALRWLPFFRLAEWLRPRVRRTSAGPENIDRVRWAVTAAARRVPWRAVCFQQGIAVQRMLCHRGIAAELHYGVAKALDPSRAGDLEAHVWVTAGAVTVIGGEVAARFTPIMVFGVRR